MRSVWSEFVTAYSVAMPVLQRVPVTRFGVSQYSRSYSIVASRWQPSGSIQVDKRPQWVVCIIEGIYPRYRFHVCVHEALGEKASSKSYMRGLDWACMSIYQVVPLISREQSASQRATGYKSQNKLPLLPATLDLSSASTDPPLARRTLERADRGRYPP